MDILWLAAGMGFFAASCGLVNLIANLRTED